METRKFIVSVTDADGVFEIPLSVKRSQVMTLISSNGESKEWLLTLSNDTRISIPISDETAERIEK